MTAALAEALDQHLPLLEEAPNEAVRRQSASQIMDAIFAAVVGNDDDNQQQLQYALIRSAFATLQTQLGPGDEQVCDMLLRVLPRAVLSNNSAEMLQILLNQLPFWTINVSLADDNDGDYNPTANEAITSIQQQQQARVLESLHQVLAHDGSTLVPILNCMASLPWMGRNETGRSEIWRVALKALPFCEEHELPTAVRTLLRHCCDGDAECEATWKALRTEWRLVEDHHQQHQRQQQMPTARTATTPAEEAQDEGALILLAHLVVTSLSDRNGDCLSMSYLKILGETSYSRHQQSKDRAGEEQDYNDDGDRPLLLDLIVLLHLSLQQNYEDAVDGIVDSWWSTGNFPFALLDDLMQLLLGRSATTTSSSSSSSNSEEQQQQSEPALLVRNLTPALLRWAIFFLLAPARCGAVSIGSDGSSHDVHNFVLNLFHRLDGERRAEMVHTLLHLSEETSASCRSNDEPESTTCRRKRLRTQPKDATKGLQQEHRQRRIVLRSVNIILKQIAETAPKTLVRFHHVLTRRLTATHAVNRNNGDGDLDSMRELCSILSSLVETTEDHHHNRRGGIDGSELLILLQKLLFSSSATFGMSTTAGGVRGDSGRMVRGIVLATELIRCPLSQSDRDCVKDWVLRLLLPSTRRMVDPELGIPGLAFLTSWQNRRLEETESTSSKVDIFEHLKMILANTGLIQVLANYQIGKNKDMVLGYVDTPPELQSPSRHSKKRDMVFCPGFFLRHVDMSNPCRWRHATQWVFDLVDIYLRMGRENAANWRPDGWLLAAMEFPILALPQNLTEKKQRTLHEWIKTNPFHFDLSGGLHSEAQLFPDFSDIVAEIRDLRVLQESSLRFALAILVGISLSAAVLKNTFEHWKTLQNDPSFDDRPGSLALIKLQMNKLYDLRQKSKYMDRFLGSLGAAIRSSSAGRKKDATIKGRRSTRNAFSVEESRMIASIDGALSETRRFYQAVYNNDKSIGIESLWECLADAEDENSLFSFLRSLEGSTQGESDSFPMILRMIALKIHLVKHLLSLLVYSPLTESGVTEPRFMHCLRHSCLLMDIIPTLRSWCFAHDKPEDYVLLSQVARLCSAYLRLYVQIWDNVGSGRSPVSFNDCVEWSYLCPELFAGNVSRALGKNKPVVDENHCFERVFEAFGVRLLGAETFNIADSLLEILSVLALGSNDQKRTEKLIEYSWTALHTIYSHEETAFDIKGLPFALSKAMQLFAANAVSSDVQVLQNVVERSVNKLTIPGKDRSISNLRRAVLRHVGLLSKSTATTFCHLGHISMMIGQLSSLCESLDIGLESDKEEEKKQGDSSRSIHLQSPSIIGLEAATFPEYFELLSHVAATLAAIMDAALRINQNCSPYQHLVDCFALFRRILALYQKHFAIFPPKNASCIINSSKEMLIVSVAQLRRCVDWRSSQPLLSIAERKAGKEDVGSIVFLQQIIDKMAAHTISAVISFCDFWQSQEGDTVRLSRCASLRYAAEKAARSIKDISSAHNLVPPSFESVEDQVSEARTKPTKGFHQMDPSARYTGGSKSERQPKLRRLFVDENVDLEGGEHESSSSDDNDDSGDSFGVAGDWGNESEDDDTDNESLNLESNLFVIRGRS